MLNVMPITTATLTMPQFLIRFNSYTLSFNKAISYIPYNRALIFDLLCSQENVPLSWHIMPQIKSDGLTIYKKMVISMLTNQLRLLIWLFKFYKSAAMHLN